MYIYSPYFKINFMLFMFKTQNVTEYIQFFLKIEKST
jgi:hypothetical protein